MKYDKNGFYKVESAICFIKSDFYPLKRVKKQFFKYEFYLGIGGNLGNTKKRFETFFNKFKKDRRFFISKTSPILLNKAFGYKNQPNFLNAVLLVQSSRCPNEVLKIMQHYENIFGRKRSFKNAPRTLDLDILYFNTKVRKTKKLIVPHYGANERISVILPLGMML